MERAAGRIVDITTQDTIMSDLVYLKPEVKMEPLVCRWYAWSHLISPVQLALHLHYRILPLMQNFVDNPMVHISANRDPSMYGGPFVSLDEADIEGVARLIADTKAGCAHLIQLAEDVRALDTDLQKAAQGYSLHEFYDRLPESLQGVVEFMYDVHHRPSFRFFEPMLYESGIADHTQEVMLQQAAEGDRHFFMSTPRIETPASQFFRMKFSDARLDMLARMRSHPASLAEVARQFEVEEQRMADFRQFFTAEAPRERTGQQYDGDGVRMRFFGHACVLFQTRDVSILFDPFVSIEEGDGQRLTFNDLPDSIDYVVISHGHQDHFNPEMLIQLRHRAKCFIVPATNSGNIADPSLKLTLKALGIHNVIVVDCYDEVEVPGGTITSLPFTGEHADLPIYGKQSVLMNLLGRKFVFLVDSDGRDAVMYRRMAAKVGAIDALFIGMECVGAPLNWLYEPLLAKPVNRRNNESRRLSGADSERASNILAELVASRVFVYAMGQEPWMKCIMGLQYTPDSTQLTEADKFIEHCESQGIPAERLYLRREVTFEGEVGCDVMSPDALVVS
ncbi:MBL fold metallo-hydrolase [Pseudomonas entomophila]|uniref:MBL fold metallo-hydrolase n=1 Tax=Pseudomonas entomophila TaxID=312306 RepID=UPI0023D80479|nr:MBL fold metallo-hydrolase [Pseudomonas entomophila]MDF0733010.1 MBL fold metallo-hydrolase [Pseudomonas entomophila]